VVIESTLTVPLCLPVLENIDDGALRKEIAEEAVRMAVSDRLGGVNGVTVEELVGTAAAARRQAASKAPPARFVARVDFDGLCDAIASMQQDHQRVVAFATEASALLEAALGTGEASTHVSVPRDVFTSLLASMKAMCTPPPPEEAPEEAAPAATSHSDADEWEAERKEFPPLIHADDDSDEDGGDREGQTEHPWDPVAAGYTAL
jgi:hypothetical protein